MGNVNSTSKWIAESIANFHEALELKVNDFEGGFFHMLDFALKLSHKSKAYFSRLLESVLFTDSILKYFLEIIYSLMRETSMLKKSSTTIQMPSK